MIQVCIVREPWLILKGEAAQPCRCRPKRQNLTTPILESREDNPIPCTMATESLGPIESSAFHALEGYLPKPSDNATSANPNNLPHVTLTYAQSLDSKISLHPNTRTNISGPETKAMTHYLRTRHDAIMVGVGTANADDPGLNSRYSSDEILPKLESQPRPIILDSTMRWQPTSRSKVLELAKRGLGKAPWWIVNNGEVAKNQDRVRMLRGVGGDVIEVRPRDWNSILSRLAAHGIRSLMVEGGAEIINGLLETRNQKYVWGSTLPKILTIR
jgi:2,5-diamino-6-(ribosylamino)-4(3H)-pyrimidinone 5'-phosphate reductase